jgi:hypothetical protein
MSATAARLVEIDMVVDNPAVKPVDRPACFDDHIIQLIAYRRYQIPNTENMMEKTASRKITKKIPSTTARVVSWPTLAALRST